MTRNGFDGAWNPICSLCGGYMHAHHKPDCPVVLHRRRENERIVELIRAAGLGGALPPSVSVSEEHAR